MAILISQLTLPQKSFKPRDKDKIASALGIVATEKYPSNTEGRH